MFNFIIKGSFDGFSKGEDGTTYLRVTASQERPFRFPRQGERAATVQLRVPPVLAAHVQTLTPGCMIHAEGIGAVGSHEWEKPAKFGQKPQTKDIINYYMEVSKFLPAPKA
jgi:hypothetical protein